MIAGKLDDRFDVKSVGTLRIEFDRLVHMMQSFSDFLSEKQADCQKRPGPSIFWILHQSQSELFFGPVVVVALVEEQTASYMILIRMTHGGIMHKKR